MKIIGTKAEIKQFQILASKGLLDNATRAEVILYPSHNNKYFIDFMDEPIEFEEVKDEKD